MNDWTHQCDDDERLPIWGCVLIVLLASVAVWAAVIEAARLVMYL